MNEEERNAATEAIRRELSDYLDEVRNKKDDEGNPTVHFPKDFDKIADSMNREDLAADSSDGNNNEWTKELFNSNMGGDQFENGRYKSFVKSIKEDSKIDKGMAQIYYLDKQLKSLINREKDIKKTNIINDNDNADNANDDNARVP